MSERYWNASIPKFINGEPLEHIDAKEKTAEILRRHGYKKIIFEWATPPLPYRGKRIPFVVDFKAYNRETNHTILCQLDGGYHYTGAYVGKTKNRNESVGEYAVNKQYGYAVLDVLDVLAGSEKWVIEEIWKKITENENKYKDKIIKNESAA